MIEVAVTPTSVAPPLPPSGAAAEGFEPPPVAAPAEPAGPPVALAPVALSPAAVCSPAPTPLSVPDVEPLPRAVTDWPRRAAAMRLSLTRMPQLVAMSAATSNATRPRM